MNDCLVVAMISQMALARPQTNDHEPDNGDSLCHRQGAWH
jgi:hypothetical protein